MNRRRARTRMPWAMATLTPLVAAGLLAAASPAGAQSPTPVDCEVLVVLASEEDGEIDSALANVHALRKPPFSAFRSMQVLSKPQVKLEDSRPISVALPNGRTVRLELEARMPDGRFKVKVSINKPNEKDYLPLLQVLASSGEPFFVAGQSYKGGTLVIGVKVGARADDSK